MLSLLIASCSSRPTHIVLTDNDANFATVSSFSLFARNSSFYNSQNISDAHRNRIEFAIEQALENKGLVYKDIDSADVVMSYFLVGQGSLSKYNRAVRFCVQCDPEQKSEANNAIADGSIIIDALDTQKQKSIWRTVIKIKQRDSKSFFKHENALKEAILEAIDEFPPQSNKEV